MKVVVLIHVMGGVLHAEILVQEIVQDVAHVQDVMDVQGAVQLVINSVHLVA